MVRRYGRSTVRIKNKMLDISINDEIMCDIRGNSERFFKMALEKENSGEIRKASEFLDMAIFYEQQLQDYIKEVNQASWE